MYKFVAVFLYEATSSQSARRNEMSLPGMAQSSAVEATRILIIGAGVAGLSAAGRLHRRGYTNIKVRGSFS